MKSPLFDQIVAAYYVNGQHVEKGRTSHMKNVPDLIRCLNISQNTEICFLDDQYHEEMKHPNVYYINLKPYVYTLPYQEMIKRFLNSNMSNHIENKNKFITSMNNELNRYNFTVKDKDPLEYKVDHAISKKIIHHLNDFFNKKHNSSIKKHKSFSKRRKTLKTN